MARKALPFTEDIALELEAFQVQREILQDGARFKVLRWGTRGGKTTYCCISSVTHALEWDPEEDADATFMWVAPTLRQARKGFRLVDRIAAPVLASRKLDPAQLSHTFINGALLDYRSAEEPDNIRGEKLKHAVVDETGSISRYAWESCIYTRLFDCEGSADIVGTPVDDPEHWAYELYREGQTGEDPEVRSWDLPTWENPYLWKRLVYAPKLAEELLGPGHTHLPKFVVDARKRMSRAAFDLEIAVKTGVSSIDYFQAPSLREMANEAKPGIKAETTSGFKYTVWEPPHAGAQYVIGVDPAEGVPGGDYSVAEVVRRDPEKLVQVAEFREHLLSDTFGDVVLELAMRYNAAHLVVESTGIGAATILRIRRKGYARLARAWNIETGKAIKDRYGWNTTEKSKKILLGDFRMYLRAREFILNSRGACLESLALRGSADGKTWLAGRKHSGFNKGMSPDRVMALALALQGHIRIPYLENLSIETPEERTSREYIKERQERLVRITGKPLEAPSSLHIP